MALDFGFQTSSSPLLSALVQAPQERQKMELLAQQARQARLDSFLNTISSAATLARTFQQIKQSNIEQQQLQGQIQGQQNLQNILTEPAPTAAVARPILQYKPALGPTLPGQSMPLVPSSTVQPLFGQTPLGTTQSARLRAATLQAFPSAAGSQLAKQQFGDTEDELMKTLRLQMLGININEKLKPTFQSRTITYNGKLMQANFDPKTGQSYLPGNKEPLTGEIGPGSFMSPVALVRRQSLINTMNMKLPELVNPARFGPNTVAGKAANVVANADSYLGQAENVISGNTIPDREIMTTLGIDAARTLTQTGVVSEKTINDLIPQSAKAKYRDWQGWLTNEPVGRDQTAFIKNLSTEVRRQRDIKQAVLDRTLGGNLPSLNELKRLSPQDWEEGLHANGLDVEAAKKGHFKLRPEILSSFYGTTQIPGVTGPSSPNGTDLGSGFSYTVR